MKDDGNIWTGNEFLRQTYIRKFEDRKLPHEPFFAFIATIKLNVKHIKNSLMMSV